MKTNKTIKFFSLLAVALVTVCASTLFASCGSDDDDKKTEVRNVITINGKEEAINAVSIAEANGTLVANLTTSILTPAGVSGNTIGITCPTSQYGKTIDLSKNNNLDWHIMGSIQGNESDLFEKGSTLFINKNGDTYTLIFNLIKKDRNGNTTTIKGSYEGKSLQVNIPQG